MAAWVLLRAGELTGNEEYSRRATTILRLLADQIRRYPSAFGFALCALDFYLSTPKEIALISTDEQSVKAMFRTLWGSYLPNRVIAVSIGDLPQQAQMIPFLQEREAPGNGSSVAYVCERYTCQLPAMTPAELLGQLGRAVPNHAQNP